MKKYKLILPIVLLLFIAGCNNDEKTVQTKNEEIQSVNVAEDSTDTSTINKGAEEKSSTNKTEDKKESSNSEGEIFIDVKTVDKNSTFPFGMSKDNVMIKLKELKLEVIDEIEITSRKNDPELGNKVFRTDGISFALDKSNQLYGINVTANIPTSLGLKTGDSLEEVEKLYGKNHNKYKVENGFIYEYTFNDHYFKVFIYADKVTHWGVSKYKFFN